MGVVQKWCCGLDVLKKAVMACIITPQGQDTQSFAATTKGLLALPDWLKDHQVTHVAMESTRVYWKPVHNCWEADFTLLVVNARHIKAVTERKTDGTWTFWTLRHLTAK